MAVVERGRLFGAVEIKGRMSVKGGALACVRQGADRYFVSDGGHLIRHSPETTRGRNSHLTRFCIRCPARSVTAKKAIEGFEKGSEIAIFW